MLCGKRRIKPTRRYTSLGLTRIVHISEGMCRQCAWEGIKLKCKICGEIIGKGYPRLLAHTTAYYTTAELFYNEEAEENIILIKTLKKEWVAKDMIYLNYDSFIQVSSSDPHASNDVMRHIEMPYTA